MISRASNMRALLDELSRKYENTQFAFEDETYFLRLLYDNNALIDDEEFLDFVYPIGAQYLSYEDNLRLAVTYDYMQEIKKAKRNSLDRTIELNKGKIVDEVNSFHIGRTDDIERLEREYSLGITRIMKDATKLILDNQYKSIEKVLKVQENATASLLDKGSAKRHFSFKQDVMQVTI